MPAHRIDDPKYEAVHYRLRWDIGEPGEHKCECGEQAQEWAYDHADPDERIDPKGRPYSLNPEHYRPMCISCHRRKDSGDTCRKGHPWTSETTYVYRGYRLCRKCRTEYMRERRSQNG